MIVGQSVRHGRHSFLQYATHFTQLLTDNIKMDTALDFNFQYYSFNNIDQNIYFCWLCWLKYSCISGWQSRLFVVMDGHVCSVLIIFIIIQYGNSTHSLIISFSSLFGDNLKTWSSVDILLQESEDALLFLYPTSETKWEDPRNDWADWLRQSKYLVLLKYHLW